MPDRTPGAAVYGGQDSVPAGASRPGADPGPPTPELGAFELRSIFESSPDGIVVVDDEGRIQAVNAKAEQLFDYPRSELLGRPIELLVPAASREAHRRHRAAYALHSGGRPMGSGLLLFGRREDGSEFPVEISLSPAATGRGTVTIATVRDVSERQRARAFGAQALRATEEERKRIARELHDDTLQTLSALLIRIRVAARAPEARPAHELLEELRVEISDAAEGVRRIARHLRPPALDELGVCAAIHEHARTLSETTGLPIVVEVEPTVDSALEEAAQLVLYRIVQEALSNTLRHAAASRVVVRLHRQGEVVVVEVEDDGRGFRPPPDGGRPERGLGLFGMSERASYVDGRVLVHSRPGEGTRVRAEIPVRRARR